MVCSLHSVTTGSRDRANVSLIIIIIIVRRESAFDAFVFCLYVYIRYNHGKPNHQTRPWNYGLSNERLVEDHF